MEPRLRVKRSCLLSTVICGVATEGETIKETLSYIPTVAQAGDAT